MAGMTRFLYFSYVWLIFVPLIIFATLVLGLTCLLIAPVVGPRRAGKFCGVPWARIGLFLSGVRVDVYGREHVNPKQSYVIVANHLSHVDIWVLYGYLGIDIRWVAKMELRRVPVVGAACVALGHVFIDRSNRRRAIASLESAKERIVNGTSIIFFPEGTRSRAGEMLPFKKGAFRMAQDLQMPILPLTISGSREILPPDSARLSPGNVRIIIHPPIPVEGTSDEELDALMDKSRAAITAGLEAGSGITTVEPS